jgi:hypothetical protein
MPDEIDLTPEEDAALDAALDSIAAETLGELGIPPGRVRELQARRPAPDLDQADEETGRRRAPGSRRVD